MTTIWKFELTCNEVVMPRGAKPLKVDAQFNAPVLWALVDPDQPVEIRRFDICCTGREVPSNSEYVGSFQLFNGAFVGHVFEVRVDVGVKN